MPYHFFFHLLNCAYVLSTLTIKSNVFLWLENGAILEMHLMHILQKLNGWGEEEGQSVCICYYTHLQNALL